MTALESTVLSYLANAVWQVPLLFMAGWLASRAVTALGPRAEHRVWVGTLLLQALLPATSTIPVEDLRSLLHLASGPQNNLEPQVSVVMGPGTALANPHMSAGLMFAVAAVYSLVTGWFVARFLWNLHRVRDLSRSATRVPLSEDIVAQWESCAEIFGVRGAALCTSPQAHGPVTLGMRRKVVILPPEMLAALPTNELNTAIAHEFAHMQRHDFLKNLLYELISLPVRSHPALWLTRNRLIETREMVCDQLAAGLSGHHQYARSLLRLASLFVNGMPARTPQTIGIFDATTFERRVMRLTRNPIQASLLRRLGTTAACILLGAGVCAGTIALSVHVDAFAAGEKTTSKTTGPIPVKANVMQNQLVHKVTPVYPPDAKKAGIQGAVELDATIAKTGEVDQLKVISGPSELQQSALDAVRQWVYKPYLLNGEPVEVKTTIHVNYSLVGKKPKSAH